MRTYRIAAVPGDGIGQETVPAAVRVLDALAGLHGFRLEWTMHPWGCAYLARTGTMMPADGLESLAGADAILLGAVGAPGVPDHESLWGLLIPIRRHFDQFVSLRPVRSLAGVEGPLRDGRPFDLVVVRENTEGEYSEIGGRLYRGRPQEMAVQEAVFTRLGVERVARYAFELAAKRSGRVASATKSNGIVHTMPFWDEILSEVAADYPDVELTPYHVDALAAHLVLDPARFDVIVASNLFGDILSDLTAALAGSIGIAPCGNIDPSRQHPSMFEPIHGSAPDIAGTGTANPIGQIWSSSLMLDHLGEREAAARLTAAIGEVVRSGSLTPDLGGSLSTAQVCDALISALTKDTAL
ncbi:tartrate dehydrogenase [Wenjunlia tyrosinilytica]|uniref:D-malate dehydrogenase (decarboxylating) n=1 Tax=Wenjunlia tyrosinilytica TaxID=1544741 RepID=A0A917ZSP1_9ACTN|nr:tartrate dehydrogenase [Wenjunlia tyrosinilytica]GGO93128.1 tartrate dehydrogenase [Wenjunlia tyrosinilytica]